MGAVEMEPHSSLKRSIPATCIGLMLLWVLSAQAEAPPSPVSTEGEDKHLERLIEQLGSGLYSNREKAQLELQRLGLAAFDALFEARHHDDIEIGMRARYLIRSMQVSWSDENDTAAVVEVLRNYNEQNEASRRSRLDRLSRLENYVGVAALCRLARFETSSQLSKYAALGILRQPRPQTRTEQSALADQIIRSAGNSRRTAATWVRAYAETLSAPTKSLPTWQHLTQLELRAVGERPEHVNREITRDLLRWYAELLFELNLPMDSQDVVRRTFDLNDNTNRQLIDTAGWLLNQQWPDLIDELYERFEDRFSSSAVLLYRLAESQRMRKQADRANTTAQLARELDPQQPKVHTEVAYGLQDRGLFDWAEQEYRYSLEHAHPGSFEDIRARYFLSEMLHDHGNDQAAAQALQGVIDAAAKDATVNKRMNGFFRQAAGFHSRCHYFYAQHLHALKQYKEERERLDQALAADPTDADVLIALYRIPDSNANERKRVLTLIGKATSEFRLEIEKYQRELDRQQTPGQLQTFLKGRLASANNLFAWLVSNTEGNLDEALQCSHRSLEIRPESAGFYDTLGRCYFAKGDIPNAIKFQSRAAKLEPHSGMIKKQLKQFRQAQEETRAPDLPDRAN